jgi:hypothetical protein
MRIAPRLNANWKRYALIFSRLIKNDLTKRAMPGKLFAFCFHQDNRTNVVRQPMGTDQTYGL